MTNRLHKVIEDLMHQNQALERRLMAAGSRSRSASESGVSSASEDEGARSMGGGAHGLKTGLGWGAGTQRI